MRVLILGRDGQLGQALAMLDWGGEAYAFGRAEADLATAAPAQLIARLKPDAVLNAAAYTNVEGAEEDPQTAMRINAEAPAELALACKQSGAWLVHYSTDYVFDGASAGPYAETDTPRPLNIYGASKLAGEIAVAQSGCKHLVLRTSWVYGAEGDNFLKRVIARARVPAEAPLTVVDDQRGAPTWSHTLARATHLALTACQARADGAALSGLYHVSPAGSCSWFEYAQDALEMLGIARAVTPVSSASFKLRARRPANSELDASRFVAAFGWQRPHWRDALRECLSRGGF